MSFQTQPSLLGAIVWVLTGLTPTDAPDEIENASIHEITQEQKRGRKICDWPVICTLPECENPESVVPDCMATLKLRSANGESSLDLRRTLEKGLEAQTDGQEWKACPDSSKLGITSLDLQLSILAPTMFGRQAIESTPDSRKILSLMLGYDTLEDIGSLADNLGRNRTVVFNRLSESVKADRDKVQIKLKSLPDIVIKNDRMRRVVSALQRVARLSQNHIKRTSTRVVDEIEKSRVRLVKVLGVTDSGSPVPTDLLEDNLIKALGHLEQGFAGVFPSVSAIRPEVALPPKDGLSPQEQIAQLEQGLDTFVKAAKERITERFQWWRKEVAPASKAKLLLMAAQSYDRAGMKCPVCEQSIKDRPVKGELETLQGCDKGLLDDLRLFFANLTKELNAVISAKLRSVADAFLRDRLLGDWRTLKTKREFAQLTTIIERFDDSVARLADTVEAPKPKLAQLLPEDADSSFVEEASSFVRDTNAAYAALAILDSAGSALDPLIQKLCDLLTATPAQKKPSLLSVLSEGRAGAQGIGPLKVLKTQLSELETDNEEISTKQATLDTLGALKTPLDELKAISKYAVDKTTAIFAEIKDKAIENWKLLYPETCTGLYPSRLVMAGRRDKSIESLLSQGTYEVPGPPFANAGLQRAVALSFLCALFDKHPHGLGFIVFDDPILSLDEDHREKWSGHILTRRMETSQIILGTHQRQFLMNCREHFSSGKVVQLNPRDRKRRISWVPGDALDQARDLLEVNWTCVPNILRQYCEEMLMTLQAYSPDEFFSMHNCAKSIERYEQLPKLNPLVGPRQKQIVAALKKPEVTHVLDPGSHAATQENITKPMVEACLSTLREHVHTNFIADVEHLQQLRRRQLRGNILSVSAISLPPALQRPITKETLFIRVIGRAAARPESWVVDSADVPTLTPFVCHGAVLVSVGTLCPVIRSGQAALLASEDIVPQDDDLVIVVCAGEHRYIRKLWSDGDSCILQAIHPTRPVPPVRVLRAQTSIRKVIGVLYEPPLCSATQAPSHTLEWDPYNAFPVEAIKSLKALLVEGNSLDPIARSRQKVLVAEGRPPALVSMEDGGLAALELRDGTIGNVIKRVHPRGKEWILVSPNPVEPRSPDVVPTEKIKLVWPLRGVLFETTDEPNGES